MPTLISSKQIQGVVTTPVIHGQLFVSGNIILTGPQFVTNGSIAHGSFTGHSSMVMVQTL